MIIGISKKKKKKKKPQRIMCRYFRFTMSNIGLKAEPCIILLDVLLGRQQNATWAWKRLNPTWNAQTHQYSSVYLLNLGDV